MPEATSRAADDGSEAVRIETADGPVLTGRLHLPRRAPGFAVVIHGGTGFPAGFYQNFAAWLAAEHGAAVLTYDYRDFGWSRHKPLRQSVATISDWALGDQSAALTFLARRFPQLRLRVIGHSLGGLWLAFHADVARIDRAVAVASGPAFWLDHPPRFFFHVLAFWWLVGPAATRLAGYLPGRVLGLGADVPAGVYWEWRKLCTTRGFHRDEWGRAYPMPRLEDARFDLTLVAIADDLLMSPPMVRQLAGVYPHARVRETLLEPRALGLKSIGHGAAFAKRNQACWPLLVESLVG